MLASSLDYEQTLARIARLAVPRLADWCAVALPDGDRAQDRRRHPRRPGQGRVRPRLPGALPDAGGAPRPAPPASCARASRRSSTTSPTSCSTPTSPTRSSARGAQDARHARRDARPDGHRRARDRRDLVRQRRVRPRASPTPTASWPRSSAAAPAPRSRTRASTASARTSPQTLQRGPAARRAAARSPACASSSLYRPGGRGEPRRRRLLRRVRDRPRLDAAGRRRHRPRRRGRRADRPGAPHAAHRGRCCWAIRPAALAQLNRALTDRRELTPCTVAIVHVTGADHRGRCAPATRSRC